MQKTSIYCTVLLCCSLVCPYYSAYSANSSELTPWQTSPDACLPFTMPSKDTILSSPKKVFANYFLRHPLSLDNRDWTEDYYTRNYLQPHGEKDKWLSEGGFIRARPLPTPKISGANSVRYEIENIKKEIRLAISRGINGFVFDILDIKDISMNGYLGNMLTAIAEVDPRFKLVISPSVSSLKNGMADVLKIIQNVYDNNNPILLHSPDGKLVIAPFNPESFPASDWLKLVEQLKTEGKDVFLMPFFLSVNDTYLTDYNKISGGFGTWGTAYPNQGITLLANTQSAHKLKKIFMAGIQPQGYRPKNFMYWEPEASAGYRNSWIGAIEGNADIIQLVTWNDFSESTQIAPYTDLSGSSGTGFFNLTGYYSSWFITGQQPQITHDVLYYFYRKHTVTATTPMAAKPTLPAFSNIKGVDVIELIAFLTEPGTLSIKIGNKEYNQEVQKGIQSIRAPLEKGLPEFSLIRHNRKIIAFRGATQIYGDNGLPSGFADLTYWSGSASANGTCFSDGVKE